MIQTRSSRAVVLSLFAVLTLCVAIGAGCSGAGDDDDDDDAATTPGPVCTPMASTLTTLQTAIFTPQCALASCHDAVAPAGGGNGVNLSTATASHADMVGVQSVGTFNAANILVVDSGSAAASYLYLKITNATGISGSPMPDTGQTLCAEKVDAIAAWINSGAQMN